MKEDVEEKKGHDAITSPRVVVSAKGDRSAVPFAVGDAANPGGYQDGSPPARR